MAPRGGWFRDSGETRLSRGTRLSREPRLSRLSRGSRGLGVCGAVRPAVGRGAKCLRGVEADETGICYLVTPKVSLKRH